MKEYPIWWPEQPPIYDIHKTYLENLEKGPFFKGALPARPLPPQNEWHDFLGFKVATPIGVPAGPLLNANWVLFAAQMGFDIVTYKTIRSKPHPAHPLPNMLYVETKGPLNLSRAEEVLSEALLPPRDMLSLAVTNSFGIPSMGHPYLVEDIARANAKLGDGQVMIVSVVGTPRPGEDFLGDFALAAQLALEGGAKIIEADLSCPNVSTCEGSLFTNPDAIYTLSRKMKQVHPSVPLILKVGVIPDDPTLRAVMRAAAKGGAEALCGINTMSMKVVNGEGKAALGEKRLTSGVCGGPIRSVALDFARRAAKVNAEEKLGLTLMATGGATLPEHFDDFFEAGASVAMSAAGMLWDPYLAVRYHTHKEQTC